MENLLHLLHPLRLHPLLLLLRLPPGIGILTGIEVEMTGEMMIEGETVLGTETMTAVDTTIETVTEAEKEIVTEEGKETGQENVTTQEGTEIRVVTETETETEEGIATEAEAEAEAGTEITLPEKDLDPLHFPLHLRDHAKDSTQINLTLLHQLFLS